MNIEETLTALIDQRIQAAIDAAMNRVFDQAKDVTVLSLELAQANKRLAALEEACCQQASYDILDQLQAESVAILRRLEDVEAEQSRLEARIDGLEDGELERVVREAVRYMLEDAELSIRLN